MKRKLWLKVTRDKYEFPLVVAMTATELGNICGCKRNTIMSSISHAKSSGYWTPYRSVEISEEEWKELR